MNVKYFYSFFALLFVASFAVAQEKNGVDEWKKSVTVKSFKTFMKEKKYDKAKNEIDGAISKYETAAHDPEMYMLKVSALNELISQENRKIYLNSKPDTAKYFSLIKEQYDAGFDCFETEQKLMSQQNGKGDKAKSKYKDDLANIVFPSRKKMLAAGKFYYVKKDYVKAFAYFSDYLDTKNSSLFVNKNDEIMTASENDLTEVSSLATLSAYASSNNKGVLTYLTESLKDKSIEEKLLEIGSKSAAAVGDSTEMVKMLENGFYSYPEVEYFYLALIKYYNDHEQYENALAKSKKMTELYPDNRNYWYIRGKEELFLSKFDDALASFNKCVEIKADDAEAFSAIGNIHLHYAHDKYEKMNLSLSDPNYSKKKAEINNSYNLACENFEKARKFDENNKSLWIDGLRETYFKLNKGKELKQLDK